MFKLIKFFVGGGLLIFSRFAASQSIADRDSLPAAIENVRPSIARITSYFTDGTESVGTGFFVNKEGFAVTAAHVIDVPPGKTLDHTTIYTSIPPMQVSGGGSTIIGGFAGSRGRVVAVDVQHDIAILLPEMNPFQQAYGKIAIHGQLVQQNAVKFAQLDGRKHRDGEQIFIAGFPLSNDVLTTTSGRIGSTHYRPGTERPPNIIWEYVADVQVNHGNSGGPVFSASSQMVIGICQAYQTATLAADGLAPNFGLRPNSAPGGQPQAVKLDGNSGLAVVIPAQYAMDLLKANGIAFSARPGWESERQGQAPPGIREVPAPASVHPQ
jgi:S1-C subfamily serine protease